LPIQATDIAELVRLLDAETHDEVLRRVELLPPSKVLSPRIHFLVAEAAEALGDTETSELARFLFVLSLRGLLSTGDGSAEAPYAVCHASDEHDLVDCLGLEIASQSLVECHGRWLDHVVCADGREVWFDATPVMFNRPKTSRRALRRRLAPAKIGPAKAARAKAARAKAARAKAARAKAARAQQLGAAAGGTIR
jgi:hypothetical protein